MQRTMPPWRILCLPLARTMPAPGIYNAHPCSVLCPLLACTMPPWARSVRTLGVFYAQPHVLCMPLARTTPPARHTMLRTMPFHPSAWYAILVPLPRRTMLYRCLSRTMRGLLSSSFARTMTYYGYPCRALCPLPTLTMVAYYALPSRVLCLLCLPLFVLSPPLLTTMPSLRASRIVPVPFHRAYYAA